MQSTLAGAALIVATCVGLPSGVLAGLKKNTRFDYTFSLLSLGGYSMPIFWLGTLLLLLFGVYWKVCHRRASSHSSAEDGPAN